MWQPRQNFFNNTLHATRGAFAPENKDSDSVWGWPECAPAGHTDRRTTWHNSLHPLMRTSRSVSWRAEIGEFYESDRSVKNLTLKMQDCAGSWRLKTFQTHATAKHYIKRCRGPVQRSPWDPVHWWLAKNNQSVTYRHKQHTRKKIEACLKLS